MASEYLLKKAKEQAPGEKPRPLTPAEKRRNWWHYHKWWVLAGLVLIWIAGSMLWNVLGIGRVEPDYIFAYVGKEPLGEATASGLEAALASLGEDSNGDGRVTVSLRQYATGRSGDPETAAYYNYAADTRLLADVTAGESYFFLTDDPLGLQRAYQLLAEADGSPPAEEDYSVTGKVLRWTDCPVLRALEADQEALSGLWLGRRCFYGQAARGHEAEEALWQMLIEGAAP